MAHPHGLVRHHLPVTNAALGTLGARTVLSLNTVMSNITTAFLILRIKYMLQISNRTLPDNGPIAALLAPGDSTPAEIASALQESNTAGPKDMTQMLTQDQKWALYNSTLRAFRPSGNDGTEQYLITGWINLNGRKGIPALEDGGFSLHAFNSGGAALTTGQTIDGSVWVEGVWLRA